MFRKTRIAPIALVFICSGCAHNPGVFRLAGPVNMPPGSGATLIPPDEKDATVTRAAVRIGPIPRKTVCGPSPHGLVAERKRVIVTREAINATTGAELFAWTVALEKQGCIPANGALRLAEAIVDAVPLDLARRAQLLQGRGDLKIDNSLRVVVPVVKAGVTLPASGPLAEITSVKEGANPGSVDVEVKANPAVIGYEIDWYDLLPQDGGPGYRIAPRSAEVHVDGAVEHPAAPGTNFFRFGAEARWYQLFMMTKVSENDFDFVVLSARSSGELQDEVAAFQRDSVAFLAAADRASYAVLPHGTGINGYIRVKVNGVFVDLPRGNTVRQAIGQAVGDQRTLMARLKVRKLHDGRLYPVEWDRATDQVLALTLEGGEEIEW